MTADESTADEGAGASGANDDQGADEPVPDAPEADDVAPDAGDAVPDAGDAAEPTPADPEPTPADPEPTPADPEPALADPEPTTGEHPGGPRREEPPFPAIAAEVREHLADDASGHDVHHVWRVFRLAQRIADDLDEATDREAVDREATDRESADREAADRETVDREVLGAAALVHDLHRVRGDGGGVDPGETLDEVRAVLEEAGFPEDKVDDVLHCVAVHDDYAFRGDPDRAETVEARVLRDADNLDATGAIGVARTFAFGGAVGTPLWDPDGEAYSQIYHFEDKLLRLADELHTDPAREIAEDRHAFLEEFRERFLAEWHGEA